MQHFLLQGSSCVPTSALAAQGGGHHSRVGDEKGEEIAKVGTGGRVFSGHGQGQGRMQHGHEG